MLRRESPTSPPSEAVSGGVAARGIEPVERETYGDGVRKVVYRDVDGNEVGLGGGPTPL